MKLEKTISRLKCGKSLKLVALGDSLTYGWMVNRGYIEFLKEMIPVMYPHNRLEIINSGIPGDTAADGMRRIDRDVLRHKPDLVFIQFALNDAYSGETPDMYRENIKGIINIIKNKTDAEILLITSVSLNNKKQNSFINEYYLMLTAVSEDYKLPVAEVHSYWERKLTEGYDFLNLVQSDLVHPTDEGYRLMAEAIMTHFEDQQ